MANSVVNVAQNGTVGVGDVIGLAPAIGFGVGKLSGKTYCFFAGTPIATEFGQKPIEQVQAGERVWSCDLSTSKWQLCSVAETYAFDHVGERIETFVDGSRIASTYHHPYWVVAGHDLDNRPKPDHVVEAAVPNAIVPGRWVDAGDLQVGDVLLFRDGRQAPVTEILVHQVHEPVYNFQVRGLHNCAVGVCAALAHNSCSDAADTKLYRGGSSLEPRVGVDIKAAPDGLFYRLGPNGKPQGISLNTNPSDPNTLRWGGAFLVENIPHGLEAIRVGKAGHYVLAPHSAMTLETYRSLLSKVNLTEFIP